MKLEAQQAAIAKVCGWKYKGPSFAHPWISPYTKKLAKHIPNYDLNDMHEAEKVFDTLKKQAGYLEHLTRVCGFDRDIQGMEEICQFAWALTHSTDAQRREAFLKTFNEWKEN